MNPLITITLLNKYKHPSSNRHYQFKINSPQFTTSDGVTNYVNDNTVRMRMISTYALKQQKFEIWKDQERFGRLLKTGVVASATLL